jgi:hypothetical protein
VLLCRSAPALLLRTPLLWPLRRRRCPTTSLVFVSLRVHLVLVPLVLSPSLVFVSLRVHLVLVPLLLSPSLVLPTPLSSPVWVPLPVRSRLLATSLILPPPLPLPLRTLVTSLLLPCVLLWWRPLAALLVSLLGGGRRSRLTTLPLSVMLDRRRRGRR